MLFEPFDSVGQSSDHFSWSPCFSKSFFIETDFYWIVKWLVHVIDIQMQMLNTKYSLLELYVTPLSFLLKMTISFTSRISFKTWKNIFYFKGEGGNFSF